MNIIIAIWSSSAAFLLYLICRTPKLTETQRVSQAAARVGFTDKEIADRVFVRGIEDELRDYGAIIADLYDTTRDEQQEGARP